MAGEPIGVRFDDYCKLDGLKGVPNWTCAGKALVDLFENAEQMRVSSRPLVP